MMHNIHKALIILAVLLATGACSEGNNNPGQLPYLTVVPTATPEGAPGEMRQLSLRVTLTEPARDNISIRYETRDGSAIAGEDYLHSAGTIQLAAGEQFGYIDIDLLGDANEEVAETFSVAIEVAGLARVTAKEITATIANDDSACDQAFDPSPNPWLVQGGDPLNFAHRGGVIDFPENTLYAYEQAAKAGADVLEMDVYQTRDDELVVLHDLDVDRTTNGTGRVASLTLAEIRALDAAYWFVTGEGTPHDRPAEDYEFRGIATGDKAPPPGYSPEDFRIPTLEEALARFPDHLINLELKPDDGVGNYEQQMATLLQQYGRSTDVIVASFVDEAANNFKTAAPCVYTSVPLDQGIRLLGEYIGSGTFQPVPEHIAAQTPLNASQIGQLGGLDLEIVDQAFVDAAQAGNLAVQVWTINSCEDMLRLIELGVDGIMTDRPLLLEDILSTPPAARQCSAD